MITKFIKLLFILFMIIIICWFIALIPIFDKPGDLKEYLSDLPQKDIQEIYSDTKLRLGDSIAEIAEYVDSTTNDQKDKHILETDIKNQYQLVSDTLNTLFFNLDTLNEQLVYEESIKVDVTPMIEEKLDIISFVNLSLETLKILGE